MFVDLEDVKVRVYLNAVKELNLCREVWSPALNQHNLRNADYYREVVKYWLFLISETKREVETFNLLDPNQIRLHYATLEL